MNLRTVLDWRSAGLFLTIDPDWKHKLWVGGWLLILPVVGWPLILGYRRVVLMRLVRGQTPIIPAWRGNLVSLLVEGFGAAAVIHLHFAPLYYWLGLFFADAGLAVPWLETIAFVLVLPIFSTLVIPFGLAFLRFGPVEVAPGAVSNLELFGLSAAFALVTFYIPAAFLRISRTGQLLSAFSALPNLRIILRSPRRYLEAWIGSLLLSLIALVCIPLSPFGVVWCYLAIVFSFNEVPLGIDEDRDGYLGESWFAYFRGNHWSHYSCVRRGWVVEYERRADEAVTEGGASRFRTLEIGPLCVPLPS